MLHRKDQRFNEIPKLRLPNSMYQQGIKIETEKAHLLFNIAKSLHLEI